MSRVCKRPLYVLGCRDNHLDKACNKLEIVTEKIKTKTNLYYSTLPLFLPREIYFFTWTMCRAKAQVSQNPFVLPAAAEKLRGVIL